nr:hypothetical protein [Tanacetum cinerariifolium]
VRPVTFLIVIVTSGQVALVIEPKDKESSLMYKQALDLLSQALEILKPCFKYKMLDAGKSLCSLLKMVFVAFPSEATSTPQDVKSLYQKVKELVQKHHASVAALQTASEDNSASMITCDLASASGSFARQGQRTDPDSTVSSSRQGADVRVVISNLKYVMKLIGGSVMLVPDSKKSITQILNSLFSEKGTDHTVLLYILDDKKYLELLYGLCEDANN